MSPKHLLLALLWAPATFAAPPPGQTYASLSELPHFDGWWQPEWPPAKWYLTAPPLKPAGLATFNRVLAAFDKGEDIDVPAHMDPQEYCRPTRFMGVMLPEPEGYLEILYSPGRVTITSESGWFRRILIDGRSPPGDPVETNSGTSIGHWEGNVLVIETVGLSRYAKFAYHGIGVVPLGRHARSTERISLKSPDVLEIDSEVVAPDSLAAPFKVSQFLKRAPNHTPQEFSFCADRNDPQIDPKSGRQRFDLTPPANLPPPPPAR